MATKTCKHTSMIEEFQSTWEGSEVDLMELVMILDASRLALQASFDSEPTRQEIIAFAEVVARQIQPNP